MPTINFIQARRRALGLTQEEFSRRAGISLVVLQRYERGACRIATSRVYNVVTLARALNATVEELYDEEARILTEEQQRELGID